MIFASERDNATFQKDYLSKRGPYREFDEDSAQARKGLIGSYAEKVIAHTDANGGSCPRRLLGH